jgi:hypothetical protein
MADCRAPRVFDPEPAEEDELVSRRPTLSVRIEEFGAGIDLARSSFVIDGRAYGGSFDESTGRLSFTPDTPLPAGEHAVEVTVVDQAGNVAPSVAFAFASAASIALDQAITYPNPARHHSTLRFNLSDIAQDVHWKIYDVSGRRIRTITRSNLAAGQHEITWDLSSRAARPVANGVYLYRLDARGSDGTRARRSGKVAVLR